MNDFNPDCLEQAPQQTNEAIAFYRQALQQAQEHIKEQFLRGAAAAELVHKRSRVIDCFLLRIWQRFFEPSNQDIALIAVGGYGRGELHPASDIDLLILLARHNHLSFQSELEQLLTFLWDIGLEVGHSVRTVAECRSEAEQDITIATNLLESRLLIGPQSLYEQMCEQTGPEHIWPSRLFFEAKIKEQQSRHHKFHDTAYNLEPNVKDGPGGLRDIQTIGWVTKRHFAATTLAELVSHQFLTDQEYADLSRGQNFLWQVRFALHTISGRREDRLLFDHQKALAEQLGYTDGKHRLAVELFMKDYFRTITELSRLNEMLLQLFQEAILYEHQATTCIAINNRFQTCNDFIEVVNKNIFKRYPFALLEIFLLLEQNQSIKGVRAETIRLIRAHRHLINANFRNDLRCSSLFMEILRQPHGVTHELRRMNRYGILAAYLPAFANIVGQMQYDLFHVYTVDDHTLMVLRNVRRFTVKDHAHEFPFCSELIQRIPKPELLYLAALFHDIAKGRGGDHSELGAADATAFCQQHYLSEYDTRLVTWLVKNHLIMSVTAQRKDISDPEVITEFADKVKNLARLDYLYLLTVADIRGTNPELWNNWKDALLQELYRATRRALREGLTNQALREQRLQENTTGAKQLLADSMTEAQIASHWQTLDEEYFLRHYPDEIAWQTHGIYQAQVKHNIPLVLVREETQRGGTEIFIYTHDRDNLFALCTLTLEQMGLTIVDARIFTSNDHYALDTFIVLDADGDPIRDPRHIHEIESTMQQSLALETFPTQQVSRRPSRQLRHFKFPSEVDFVNDPVKQHTIMHLQAADRPGLLARIGQALVECNISVHHAKIATYGARVEDSFIITSKDCQPLSAEQCAQLRAAIIHLLDYD